jgi:hypothetical protein
MKGIATHWARAAKKAAATAIMATLPARPMRRALRLALGGFGGLAAFALVLPVPAVISANPVAFQAASP